MEPVTDAYISKMASSWWHEATTLLRNVRAERARDEDYYDGIQWTDTEIAALKKRGQAPLVMNAIAPVVNWMVGTERRTRTDHRVLARSKDDDDLEMALTKSHLMKYVSDANDLPAENSLAFKDGVISGEGWVEIGVSDNDDEETVFVKREDWRNLWPDYRAKSPTYKDARYIFRSKWLDVDVARAMFPDKDAIIKNAGSGTMLFASSDPASQLPPGNNTLPFVGSDRPLVRIVEGWFRIPSTSKRVVGGAFDGYFVDQVKDVLDQYDDLMMQVESGEAELVDTTSMRVYLGHFLDAGSTAPSNDAADLMMLSSGPSPYKHNRLPFVRYILYSRRRDNTPYGLVRNSIGPQDDLNKRHSKALHILSSTRIIASEDAASPTGWDKIEDEVSRPDAIIRLDGRRDARFDMDTNAQIADAHINLMENDRQTVYRTAGVSEESMGFGSEYASGKAVLARQDQGTVVTTEAFDNYRLMLKLEGEIMLSLIEQFYTEQKTIRVADAKGAYQYHEVNVVNDDGTIENDIAATKHDFVVSEVDYRDSLRQSMFDQLTELTTKLDPQVALQILDLVIDMSDLPEKKNLVERIRAINGQAPPKDESLPQDREAEAQRQQDDAAKKQRDAAMEQEQLREQTAEADRKAADAKYKAAKAAQTQQQSVKTAIDAKNAARSGAIEAAKSLSLIPKE